MKTTVTGDRFFIHLISLSNLILETMTSQIFMKYFIGEHDIVPLSLNVVRIIQTIRVLILIVTFVNFVEFFILDIDIFIIFTVDSEFF